MVVGDQPLPVLPLVHKRVARIHGLAVAKLERVGAHILRDVAADLDDALVYRALRLAFQEFDEIVANLEEVCARLVGNRRQQHAVGSVIGDDLVRVTCSQGSVPTVEQRGDLSVGDRCARLRAGRHRHK